MYYNFRLRLTFFLCSAYFFAACGKEVSSEDSNVEVSKVAIELSHFVRDLPLNKTDEYITDLGENYHINTFRYYVHNIELTNEAGGSVLLSPGYYLVDEDLPASKKLSFNAPAGSYKTIVFTLGVDSADNMSGAQAGALDPANGMFWAWSSGYVMAKLEGVSPVVTGPNSSFSYHVGGYKAPYAVIKKISLSMGSPATGIVIPGGDSITMHINADINTWFGRVNPIRMALTPACHSPGDLAKKISDNYEGMFSLKNIE